MKSIIRLESNRIERQFDNCDFISFEALRFSESTRQSRRLAAKDYSFSRPSGIEFLGLDNSCPSMLSEAPFAFHLPLEASDDVDTAENLTAVAVCSR